MLYKPIVSLIVAFSAASSATASVTPLRRGGNGGYPPPSEKSTSISQCNTNNNAQCCNTYTSASNPQALELASVLGVILNPTAGIGLSCLPIVSNTCGANAVCCTNVVQNGLINVGCSPLEL